MRQAQGGWAQAWIHIKHHWVEACNMKLRNWASSLLSLVWPIWITGIWAESYQHPHGMQWCVLGLYSISILMRGSCLLPSSAQFTICCRSGFLKDRYLRPIFIWDYGMKPLIKLRPLYFHARSYVLGHQATNAFHSAFHARQREETRKSALCACFASQIDGQLLPLLY